MKSKWINWKRFAMLFTVLNVAMFLTGCGWVSAVQGMFPAIKIAITALFSLIGALTGKTIPTSVTDFVNKVETAVSAGLTTLGDILSTITANASQTVLAQIEAVFQTITTDLNSLLAGLNVTDTSTIGRITDIVAGVVAAVEAILALIPLAMKASDPNIVGYLTDEEKLKADKAATSSLKNAHKVFQQRYAVAVVPDTENQDVNTALAALPKTLP